MNDLPTPEELGEKLKRGEITKEEAIEVMSERARREAFAQMYAPPAGDRHGRGTAQGADRSAQRAGRWVLVGIIVLLVILYILLQVLG
ncbi:MAG: hypothetical protein JXR77_12350 [Lentisphaeria bacterium]|nr:hypothetical protein [Lentisphaeria bacterium]